ncbi:NAD(P)H-quinone oxidoreductase [Demequina sp.]|uniref:NAD(P)H-quinone oxidoreductase n=1 Tax=Demequina sp. TaxID=2050685 RepID=UPI003D13A60D
MKVATLPGFTDSGDLVIEDAPVPRPGPHEVLIRVAAAGVNRADVLQKRGLYPSPPGSPAWPGLEVAGVIEEVGEGVTEWSAGHRVCALLPGGGYGEYAVCNSSLVLPTPSGISDVEAAALPEAACTVWSNLRAGGFPGIDSVLVHGGSGGIGTTAIQLGKALGLTVFVTAGGEERARRCGQLGADLAVDYRSQDFVAAVRERGGVDMVLDCVGRDYLANNLEVLRDDGTLVIIGLQSGAKAEINLGTVLSKRLTVAGTTLRSRPLAQRAAIVASVHEHVWPLVPTAVRPVIHDVFSLKDVNAAHRALESGEVFGKVVLSVG